MKTTTAFALALLFVAMSVAVPVSAQQGFYRTTMGTVRILQSSAGGDNILLIDPATNTVVGEIDDIPIPHGVSNSPDGKYIYVSNEHDETLDVVSRETLKVIKHIPLSDGPNNIAITPDGRKLYVAINSGDGGVDVIDTQSLTNVRHIPTVGGVHNVFVSPNGRDLIAGMIGQRVMTVIDTSTDQPVWSVQFEGGGPRPMEFDVNPDGSTKRIFVQLSGLHGFVVVDYKTQEVVDKIELPRPPIAETDNDALQTSPSHGMARTPDGETLWVASKPSNTLFAYSLPDLELIGGVKVGHHPDWLSVTPDSRYVYASNVGSNAVSVVDRQTMKEVTEIPVGHAPKRSHMAVFPN